LFLDYLKFLALIDDSVYGLAGRNTSDFLELLVFIHGPIIMLGSNLLMSSQKHGNRCAVITGIFCALIFMAAVTVPIWYRDEGSGPFVGLGAFIAFAIGITSINCAIAAAIGFSVRRALDGKAYRAVVSVSLFLVCVEENT
jgi:hypothetical protein